MNKISFQTVIVLLFLQGGIIMSQPLAFPEAEGGGKFTSGGRGGNVMFVDNLNDHGPGSLRMAIESKGPRLVLFCVSGIISLEKPIRIQNDSITIAGQTAPGDGICLKNFGMIVDANNVIIRYIRIRPGDESQQEMDAISGTSHHDMMVDHCSFSWSNDETASFYNNTDFTLQWCIISESLNKSVHHKGEHGYGGIWGGNNASFHHNLLSDHTSRNPRFCGSRYTNKPDEEKVDFRNNVIYNWGNNSTYGGEEGFYNMVNNYYKPGPATGKSSSARILDLTLKFFDPRYNQDTLGHGQFYLEGNIMEGHPEVSKDNWGLGVQGNGVTKEVKEKARLMKPVSYTPMKTQSAEDAYRDVLIYAGACLHRDSTDSRIIREVRSGTEIYGETFRNGKKGIIDSPLEVGGWSLLRQDPAPSDTDKDGMPDTWEKKHKLNPADPSDNKLYTLSRFYTNIEVYINQLTESGNR